MRKIRVLAVDDEENILWLLKEGLSDEKIDVLTTTEPETAENYLNKGVDICLVDIFLGTHNGIDLTEKWSPMFKDTHFIIMTAQDSGSNVIESIKSGAKDFFSKPFDLLELKNKIISLCGKIEYSPSGSEIKEYDFETKNKKMLEIYKLIGKISKTNINILILGESGTGKEVIARMIHKQSARNSKPFIPINMAAIPNELLESELFGHEKGSFTGAVNEKKGKFEEANHGTIFLDEISEMDLGLQSKLLRVIQEKEVTRIGSSKTLKLDTRIIAASNRNLEELVSAGKFREDLYYRLNVVSIELPPLYERKEDTAYLTNHFLNKHKNIKDKVLNCSDEALDALTAYRWPGNIRELENTIQYAIVNTETDVITAEDLPAKIFNQTHNSGASSTSSDLYKLASDIIESESLSEGNNAYEEYMKIVEYPLIKAILDRTNNNKSISAKILGINRNTFRKKVREHGFEQDS
jgi:DNA-binding NtrC family response regulator